MLAKILLQAYEKVQDIHNVSIITVLVRARAYFCHTISYAVQEVKVEVSQETSALQDLLRCLKHKVFECWQQLFNILRAPSRGYLKHNSALFFGQFQL
jgi:hypothetical protein